jgi:APA family basic amino acid/polyamine antiporter
LLPKGLSKVNPKTKTPTKSIWLTALMVSTFSGLVPINHLADLTNIGTLFAFIVVSMGVIVLRKTQPNLKRSFKVPFSPVLPLLSILSCGYLIFSLSSLTWLGFAIWFVIGLVLYMSYGYKHSLLSNKNIQ